MLKNAHKHIFNWQTIPAEVYFGRHGLNGLMMKIIRWILAWVQKNGLPDDVEEVIALAEKFLPLVRLDDDWDRVKYLVRMYYSDVGKIVTLYKKEATTLCGVDEMCILIPNFQDKQTHEAVDLICAAVGKDPMFKIFAPLAFVDRDEVWGVKYYPALEGPADWLDKEWSHVADLGKPVSSHSSPGGVRNKKFPEALAKKYNTPGRWMNPLQKYPLRLNLCHVGGRAAFVRWFTEDKQKPGVNWAYDNMVRSFDGVEYPGKVFIDVAFHEDQPRSDYRKAVANVDGYWNDRVMFGTDGPLPEIQYDEKTAASWFRNVWGVGGCDSANRAYKEFIYGNVH